jgi:hypothetical protein
MYGQAGRMIVLINVNNWGRRRLFPGATSMAAPCFAANKFQRMPGGNEANSTSKVSLSFPLKE